MFLGDWLKSEKGVIFARMERILVGLCSMCVDSPGEISCGTTAIDMYGCSNGPTQSFFPRARYLTGRIILAGCDDMKMPGYCPPLVSGINPISSSTGILCSPPTFQYLNVSARVFACLGVQYPKILPSSWMHSDSF